MSSPWLVKVREVETGTEISVGRLGTQPAEVRRQPADLERTRRVLQELQGAEAWPVLLSAAERAWAAYESEVSSALAGLFDHPDLQRALVGLESDGQAVVVDADERARHWPWEMLAVRPRGELVESLGLPVVRLAPGGRAPEPREGPWRVALWCDEESEETRAVRAGLWRACEQAKLSEPLACAGDPPVDRRPRLLVWAVHGADEVVDSSTSMSHASAVHAWSRWIRWADLAVIVSCHAGASRAQVSAELPMRLLSHGCRGVFAPGGALAVGSAVVAIRSVVGCLAEGGTVAHAVSAARREVRAQAGPLPEERWWGLRAWVSDVEVLDLCGPRPPRARVSSASDLLATARRLSAQLSSSFLGLEHVLLAVLMAPPVGATAALRRVLNGVRPELEARLASFRGTERHSTLALERLAALADAPLEIWLQHLVQAAGPLLTTLTPSLVGLGASHEREGWTTFTDAAAGPITCWRVVGGPDDGRELPCDGRAVGHAWPGGDESQIGLYGQASRRVDARLSRAHARLFTGGAVELLRPAFALVQRAGPLRHGVHGSVECRPGDVIGLTGLTWIVACP